MIAEILDETGKVINTIVADAEFLDAEHPGRWREVIPPFDLADAKSTLRAEVDRLVVEKVAAGVLYDFGDPWGVKLMQTREEDKPNWLALATTATAMVSRDQGDAACGAIRTEDNVNIPVNANQAQTVMLAMQADLAMRLAYSWALKDAIRAAEDEAALTAIDIIAGWPA